MVIELGNYILGYLPDLKFFDSVIVYSSKCVVYIKLNCARYIVIDSMGRNFRSLLFECWQKLNNTV